MNDRKDNIRAYWLRLLDERLRSYVVVAAAALLVIFVVGMASGSLMAGVVPLAFGVLALGLRWPVMPLLCVVTVAWFQALPFGIPIVSPQPIDPQFTHFRFGDLLLVAGVLIYLIAQYRVYSLTHAVVPDDRIFRARRKLEMPDLRDPGCVDEREIPVVLIVVAAALIAGQFLWLFLSETVLNFRILPPLQIREGFRGESLPAHASRVVMFGIGLGVTVFLARLLLWVWRLRALNHDEAQLVLADTGWIEMRREAARLETWRSYGKYRSRAKVVVPVPKRKPKRREPWLFAALGRACLTLMVAIVIALLLVCGGSYLFFQLFR